ncbi:MAG: RNA methyltransferase [Thiobacillaceae bacterium]|nr:RNA methyltransferase [Thiobacillaceae bacterium]MCX7672656.1 RNA methyltransferase [Thiobacillaceae bacterium]MDW8323670.1 RNA methyltransferase [Burkholderiales bacterium]
MTERHPRLIHSRANPTYRWLSALAQDKRVRRQEGLTLLDGEHLIATAVDAGVTPRLLVAGPQAQGDGRFDRWLERCPGAEGLILSESLLRALAPTQTPTGLLAVAAVPRPQDRPQGRPIRCAVLLEDVQDPGNLGAILRSAAAAGADATLLSPGCCEAFSPKALRGGQGAQYLLDVYEDTDLSAWLKTWPGAVHAAVLGGRCSLYDLDLTGRCAFVFGNEGAGLSAGLRALAQPYTIPMPGRVESLNVAAAVAVTLFERVRQLAAAAGLTPARES